MEERKAGAGDDADVPWVEAGLIQAAETDLDVARWPSRPGRVVRRGAGCTAVGRR